MKIKMLFSTLFLCLLLLSSSAFLVKAEEADTISKVYSDDGIITDIKVFEFNLKAGENYDVSISFMGTLQSGSTLSFTYNEVTNDQMIPNISTSTDKSGLLLENITPDKEETRTFSYAAIDDILKISATGSGKVTKIEIKKKQKLSTVNKKVLTIGDSLVQTYSATFAPQTGWGQILPELFTKDVECQNYALGGRSSKSYIIEGRLNNVLLNVNEGDCVLIEFGHNDATVSNEYRYASPEDFEKYIIDFYVKAIRQRGGIPVLVTLANRNDYSTNGDFKVSFKRYVDAMKNAATLSNTQLIDLNTLSVNLLTDLNKKYGIGISEDIIFNYAKAGEFSGAYINGVKDNTHYQKYGATLLAKLVAKELSTLSIPKISEFVLIPKEPTKVPLTPENLRKKFEGQNIHRIAWDASENADFYKVYAVSTKNKKPEGEYKLLGYTANCDYLNEDAFFNSDYLYKVVAINSVGESKESKTFLFEALNNKNKETNSYVVDTKETKEEPTISIYILIPVLLVIIIIIFLGVKYRKKKLAKD